MITKYSNNPQGYDELFKQATARLQEIDSYSEVTINTLSDYFKYLPQLIYKQSDLGNITDFNNSDFDYNFLQLPLDEPHFIINTNTREIQVPSEFRQNGVSVLGDHGAEMIFFEVDRFYDVTDLATQKIAIFWQAPGETQIHADKSFNPIVFIKDGEDKLLFGWEISSALTKKPGKLSFSVRFYTSAKESTSNYSLIYSLSTLPQSITINPGMTYDIAGINIVDSTKMSIWKRLINQAQPPELEDDKIEVDIPIFAYTQYQIDTKTIQENSLTDITDDIKHQIRFGGLALKEGSGYGVIGYRLEYRANENQEWQPYNNLTDYIIPLVENTYLPITEYNKDFVYFQKTNDNEYVKVDPNTVNGENIKNNNYYINGALYEIPFTPVAIDGNIENAQQIIGEYRLRARNSAYSQYAYDNYDQSPIQWSIQGPKEIDEYRIEWPIVNDDVNYIMLDGTAKDVKVIDNTDYGYNDNQQYYKWYCNDNMLDNHTNTLTLDNNSVEGEYKCKMYNQRNNARSVEVVSESKYVIKPLPDHTFNIIKTVNGDGTTTIRVQLDSNSHLTYGEQLKYKWTTSQGDQNTENNSYTYNMVSENDVLGYAVTVTSTKIINQEVIESKTFPAISF